MDSRMFESTFVSRDEKLVAVMGNNAAQNFLSTGTLGNGFAVLSNRRVYFRGKCIVSEGGHTSYQLEERIVDVDDVSSTGFIYRKPIGLIVMAVIFGILAFVMLMIALDERHNEELLMIFGASALVCVLSIVMYFLKRQVLFQISFAGGSICFRVSWYSPEEIESFQAYLVAVRDSVKALYQFRAPVNQ